MASPFQYFISLTGDCSNTNSGAISISFSGGTPPYSVQWVSPNLGLDVVTLNPSVRTGLTTTTYGLYVVDSTLPLNLSFPIDIPISSKISFIIF